MSAIRLEFKGTVYEVQENRAFEAGEMLEEIVSIAEIGSWGNSPKFHKLARVFSVLLNYAGADVTKEEVFAEMMREIHTAGDDADGILAVKAVEALVGVLMDGAPDEIEGEGEPLKKVTASSKSRTKQRSKS